MMENLVKSLTWPDDSFDATPKILLYKKEA